MTRLYDAVFRRIGPAALDFASYYQAHLERLRRSQFLPPDQLRRRQQERLKLLCEYAFRHVPLFRKLGGAPDFADLCELPILSRSALRDNLHFAVSNGGSWLYRRHGVTSGSSGNPLEFWTDRRSSGLRLAARYLFDEWLGLPFGSRIARIVTSPSRFPRLLANEMHIPLASVNSKTAPTVLERILHFGPRCLIGPPSSLGLLAEAGSKTSLSDSKRIHCMVATAEGLLESQRETIQSAFDCSVYNRYGLREISGYVAQECKEQRGLHVNVDHVILEIVDNGHPVADGKPGRVVITDLHNRIMPLIRYDTEDIGTLSTEPCICGMTWPLLETVHGRESDYVVAKNGTRIPLIIFAGEFARSFVKSIVQVQFLQRREGSVSVRIVPRKGFTPEDMVRVRSYFSRLLPSFDVELVHDLPSLKSGKRPLLVKESRDG